MSRLFGEQHRELQDAFGTRQLADRIEEIACVTEFSDEAKAFIEAQDMFFLATTDHNGRPTVSYKGGDAGFVKIIDAKTLVFPNYDGNGMYMSMGNAALNHEVGLLFISFEKPHRIRVQGKATITRDDALLAQCPGADMLVRVTLSEMWKQIDIVQDVISDAEKKKAQEAGIIEADAWMEKVKTGDPTA